MRVCKPFLVDGKRVGVLLPRVIKEMKQFPDVFHIQCSEDGEIQGVELQKDFNSYEAKTSAIAKAVNTWRSKDVFCALRGWRDEVRYHTLFPQC